MIWRRIHALVDDAQLKLAVILECEHTLRIDRTRAKNLRIGARVPCSHCSMSQL